VIRRKPSDSFAPPPPPAPPSPTFALWAPISPVKSATLAPPPTFTRSADLIIPTDVVTHPVAKCRWCGNQFRQIEDGAHWICLSEACATRQLEAAVSHPHPTNFAGQRLYVPLPLQVDIEEHPARHLLVAGAAGISKALDVDTLIPTPIGLVRMGDLEIGGEVFDEHGNECHITDATPEHVDPTGCYRVIFDDHSEIVAGGTHEWLTLNASERELAWRPSSRRRAGGSIKTTLQILATLRIGSRSNHAIPITTRPWDTGRKRLPIPPYTLGAWLANGTGVTGVITTPDAPVIAAIESEGFACHRFPSAKYGWRVDGLTSQLAEYGLIANKHVPEAYFVAAPAQRLKLLQGLMDGDGHVSPKQGLAVFTNMSRPLAAAVDRLAASLGAKPFRTTSRAVLNGVDHGEAQHVYWTSTLQAFAMPRKVAHLPTRLRGTQQFRYIKSIERVPDRPLRCISVDSPSRLFLAGERGIPTHNSYCARWGLYKRCREVEGFRALLIRSTYPEVERGHLQFMTREAQLLGDARYVGYQTREMRFSNGSIIFAGSCDDDRALSRHLGFEADRIVIDEAVSLAPKSLNELIPRARGSQPARAAMARLGLKPSTACITNPGGRSMLYLIDHYIRRQPDREEYPTYQADNYDYITGTLEDNPFLAPDYEKTELSGLSSARYKQLRYGDWTSVAGQYFSEFCEELHITDDPNRAVPVGR
jgi:hypothetical protein